MAKCRYVPSVLGSPLYSQVPLSTRSVPLQTVSSRFSSPRYSVPRSPLSLNSLLAFRLPSGRSRSSPLPHSVPLPSRPSSKYSYLSLVPSTSPLRGMVWRRVGAIPYRRSIVVVSPVVLCCMCWSSVRVVPCGQLAFVFLGFVQSHLLRQFPCTFECWEE